MTSESLPQIDDVDALTGALRRCRVLLDERVTAVAVESARTTVLSEITRLRLTYNGAAPTAPASLIVKTGRPERRTSGWDGGRQEVAFYNQVGAVTPAGLLPRCFAAMWDEATNDWRLLLEDLGDSHFVATTWPLPPAREVCERILRAWARFHAHWWDDERLGVAVGQWDNSASVEAYLTLLRETFVQFVDRFEDLLSSPRRALYEAVLDQAPRLLARVGARRNVTIVHGDAHVWNCFLPRDIGGDVRLFDWDSWRLGVATDDLAYMMAMHWYPDRRSRMERPLLDIYHTALQAHGVEGYDRQALGDDYRLSVLWQVQTPLWQAGANIPPLIWWNNLERIFLAVDDLGCRELLE